MILGSPKKTEIKSGDQLTNIFKHKETHDCRNASDKSQISSPKAQLNFFERRKLIISRRNLMSPPPKASLSSLLDLNLENPKVRKLNIASKFHF